MNCNSAMAKITTLDNSLSHLRRCMQEYDDGLAKIATLENCLSDIQKSSQGSPDLGSCHKEDYQAKVTCTSIVDSLISSATQT